MDPATPSAAPAADPQREQLAKLLAYISAQQATGKYSPENLWALQGQQQLPQPPSQIERIPVRRDDPRSAEGYALPVPKTPDPNSRGYFPTAPAGHDAPDPFQRDPAMAPQPMPPFPMATRVEEMGPYVLPKSPEKKPEKKAKR